MSFQARISQNNTELVTKHPIYRPYCHIAVISLVAYSRYIGRCTVSFELQGLHLELLGKKQYGYGSLSTAHQTICHYDHCI